MRNRVKTLEEAEAMWKEIPVALQIIYDKQASKLKYQSLFDVFHQLSISEFADRVERWLVDSIQVIADRVHTSVHQASAQKLSAFNSCMLNYVDMCDKLQKIAVYYDARYAIPRSLSPTMVLGYNVISSKFKASEVLKEIVLEVLDGIDGKRKGQYHDFLTLRTAAHNIVEFKFIQVDLGQKTVYFEDADSQNNGPKTIKLEQGLDLYKQEFEPLFIDRCIEYHDKRVGSEGTDLLGGLAEQIQRM